MSVPALMLNSIQCAPGCVEVHDHRLVPLGELLKLLAGLDGLDGSAKILVAAAVLACLLEVLQAALWSHLDALAAWLPVCRAHLHACMHALHHLLIAHEACTPVLMAQLAVPPN